MDKISFGENLKQLRITEGVGQTAIADALNISVKTISHWETNYTEPSIAQLIQLADFFDISLDDLVGRTKNN
ncbi:MAG: helix-turn-helix domain-containing protein [Clostridia bacterium]|nr:helix-turn-helix domain-containing protein [Clostridia bacterium]MDE7214911.1 helix-turn-helix domain-containing protein [Clostridia bacterium]